MILSSAGSNGLSRQQAAPASAAQVVADDKQASQDEQQQTYKHKLNQVKLRTSKQDDLEANSGGLFSAGQRPSDDQQQQHANNQSAAETRRGRSRAESAARLSVILPPSRLLEQPPSWQQQQQPPPLGASLETPVPVHSSELATARQQQLVQSGSAAAAGFPFYSSLMQSLAVDVGDTVGYFTGLPSCTPTSADALAASANLRTVNPFFLSVSAYNGAQQHAQAACSNKQTTLSCDSSAPAPQASQEDLPEDLSPSTKVRLSAQPQHSQPQSQPQAPVAGSTDDNQVRVRTQQQPLHVGMLSPIYLPSLLSPTQEHWIRQQLQLNPGKGAQPAPQPAQLAGQFATFRAAHHHQLQQLQQQPHQQPPSSSPRQQQPAGSECYASSAARDLTNQFVVGQQQQRSQAALTTAPTLAASDPQGSSNQLARATVLAADTSTAAAPAATVMMTHACAGNVAPPLQQQSFARAHWMQPLDNQSCPPQATAYMFLPASQQQQPVVAEQFHQRQIFIPVHQHQPVAQSRPMQAPPFQQSRQLSAKDSLRQAPEVTAPREQQHVYLAEQNARQSDAAQQSLRYISSSSPQQQQQQPQGHQQQQQRQQAHLSIPETLENPSSRNASPSSAGPREATNSDRSLRRDLAELNSRSEGENSLANGAASDSGSTKTNAANNGLGSNSNSSSVFNCNSPASNTELCTSSSSSSACSIISRDSPSMTTPVTRPPTPTSTDSKPNESKVTQAPASGGARKRTKIDNDEPDSLNTTVIVATNEMPVVKKKSKGGRKKKQVTHEEMIARKNRSKERNRVAAKRCRQKRKQFIDDLQAKIDNYNDLNRKLQRENAQLREELNTLRKKHQECGR